MRLTMKALGTTLLLVGMGGLLAAQNCIPGVNCPAPEIDGTTAGNALALLGGAILMLRSRKK